MYRPPKDLEKALTNSQEKWNEIAKELEHFRVKNNKMTTNLLCNI